MTKININGHKKVFNKRKFKFQEYKNCLEAAQIGNMINHFEKKLMHIAIKNL